MANAAYKCPNCSESLGYGAVAFGLFPPRVKCPTCGERLTGFRFARLPPASLVLISLGVGLAASVIAGAVVAALSRDWPNSYRFATLGVVIVSGALLMTFGRFKSRKGNGGN